MFRTQITISCTEAVTGGGFRSRTTLRSREKNRERTRHRGPPSALWVIAAGARPETRTGWELSEGRLHIKLVAPSSIHFLTFKRPVASGFQPQSLQHQRIQRFRMQATHLAD